MKNVVKINKKSKSTLPKIYKDTLKSMIKNNSEIIDIPFFGGLPLIEYQPRKKEKRKEHSIKYDMKHLYQEEYNKNYPSLQMNSSKVDAKEMDRIFSLKDKSKNLGHHKKSNSTNNPTFPNKEVSDLLSFPRQTRPNYVNLIFGEDNTINPSIHQQLFILRKYMTYAYEAVERLIHKKKAPSQPVSEVISVSSEAEFYERLKEFNLNNKEKIKELNHFQKDHNAKTLQKKENKVSVEHKFDVVDNFLDSILEKISRKVNYVNEKNLDLAKENVVNLMRDEIINLTKNFEKIVQFPVFVKNFSTNEDKNFILPLIHDINHKDNHQNERNRKLIRKYDDNLTPIRESRDSNKSRMSNDDILYKKLKNISASDFFDKVKVKNKDKNKLEENINNNSNSHNNHGDSSTRANIKNDQSITNTNLEETKIQDNNDNKKNEKNDLTNELQDESPRKIEVRIIRKSKNNSPQKSKEHSLNSTKKSLKEETGDKQKDKNHPQFKKKDPYNNQDDKLRSILEGIETNREVEITEKNEEIEDEQAKKLQLEIVKKKEEEEEKIQKENLKKQMEEEIHRVEIEKQKQIEENILIDKKKKEEEAIRKREEYETKKQSETKKIREIQLKNEEKKQKIKEEEELKKKSEKSSQNKKNGSKNSSGKDLIEIKEENQINQIIKTEEQKKLEEKEMFEKQIRDIEKRREISEKMNKAIEEKLKEKENQKETENDLKNQQSSKRKKKSPKVKKEQEKSSESKTRLKENDKQSNKNNQKPSTKDKAATNNERTNQLKKKNEAKEINKNELNRRNSPIKENLQKDGGGSLKHLGNKEEKKEDIRKKTNPFVDPQKMKELREKLEKMANKDIIEHTRNNPNNELEKSDTSKDKLDKLTLNSKRSKLSINTNSNRFSSYEKELNDHVDELLQQDLKNQTGDFKVLEKEENKLSLDGVIRKDYLTPKVKRMAKASINDILLKLNKRNSNQHSIFKELAEKNMYEFVRKKYEKLHNLPLETLKLEDIISEDEKKEFMKKIDKFEFVENLKLDQNLNEAVKQQRLDLMYKEVYEEIQMHLNKSELNQDELLRLKELKAKLDILKKFQMNEYLIKLEQKYVTFFDEMEILHQARKEEERINNFITDLNHFRMGRKNEKDSKKNRVKVRDRSAVCILNPILPFSDQEGIK